MEGLTRLVSESLARYGVDSVIDHRRLQWSRWFACESSSDVLLVPSRPGLFALAEEILAPGEASGTGGKRMLALLQFDQADDLGMALTRLFAPGNRIRERTARVFARYTAIEDDAQRRVAFAALQRWLATSSEVATGISSDSGEMMAFPSNEAPFEAHRARTEVPALPSGF